MMEPKNIIIKGQEYKFLKKINKNLYLFENELYGYKECFDELDVKRYSDPENYKKEAIKKLQKAISKSKKIKEKTEAEIKYAEYQKKYQEEYRKKNKAKIQEKARKYYEKHSFEIAQKQNLKYQNKKLLNLQSEKVEE